MSVDYASATMSTTAAPAEVDAYARKALVASTLGYAMDGFDLLILGFILGPLAAGLHLSRPQAGSLVTWTLVGAVIGGLTAGALSALAQGYWDLLVYRTIAGIGLGGEFGVGMALAAEAWPASKRARATSYVGLGWQAGVLVAAFLTPLLLPYIGWRGMFVVGVIPALLAFGIRRFVGEPALFLDAQKKQPINPYSVLFADREATAASIGIAIMTSVQNFGYYATMIWLPSYLSTQLGFSLTQSSLWISATVLGGAVGMLIFGFMADRVGRKPLFVAFQIGAAIMALVFPNVTQPNLLLLVAGISGIFLSGMIGGYGALIAESYPTQGRSTAQNVLFNFGRGVGGFGPLVIGLLATQYSLATALSFLVVIWIVDVFATVFLIKERKGEPLR